MKDSIAMWGIVCVGLRCIVLVGLIVVVVFWAAGGVVESNAAASWTCTLTNRRDARHKACDQNRLQSTLYNMSLSRATQKYGMD